MIKRRHVLAVDFGNMGLSHAKAYDALDGFELAGFCARTMAPRADLPPSWADVPRFADYGQARSSTRASAPSRW